MCVDTALVTLPRLGGAWRAAVALARHLRERISPRPAAPAPAVTRALRPVIVPGALSDLRGPAAGVVELPQRLCWSLPEDRRRFDLADPHQVRTVEDLLAAKTLALVDRSSARDFWDIYEAMLQGWTPEQLIGLAWQLNPDDYDAAYFTEVLDNLADLDDFEFRQLGLSGRQVADLRAAFERQWPRRNG
jgi:hypothetical protein